MEGLSFAQVNMETTGIDARAMNINFEAALPFSSGTVTL